MPRNNPILAAVLSGTAAFLCTPSTGQGPLPPTVLVMADTGEGVRANLTRDFARSLGRALAEKGHPVVDREQARAIAERSRAGIRAAFGPDEDQPADVILARRSPADLLVRVRVAVQRERKQQGRYRVQNRVDVRVLRADDPILALDVEGKASANSLDSYADAHDRSLASFTAADGSFVASITERIAAIRRDEAEKGARFVVALFTDSPAAASSEEFATALGKIDGVVTGSIAAKRGVAVLQGDRKRESVDYSLRFKGDARALRAALAGVVAKRSEQLSANESRELYPVFVTSHRRIELVIRSRAKEQPPDEALQAMVDDAVRRLYDSHSEFLNGRAISVMPAAIGNKKLKERDAAFDASPAGRVAQALSTRVTDSLEKVSKRKVNVLLDDLTQDKAVSLIEREAELYRDEGSVDPDTIALLERKSPSAMVLTSLTKVLDHVELALSIVDLNSGETVREFATIAGSLATEVDKRVGGL